MDQILPQLKESQVEKNMNNKMETVVSPETLTPKTYMGWGLRFGFWTLGFSVKHLKRVMDWHSRWGA